MMPRPLRDRLVVLLRWRHWSSVIIAGGAVVVVADLLKETVGQTSPLSPSSFVVLAIGLILKVRDLFRDFRVRRLLRPEYRGLDDFARRINASPMFGAAFLTRDPGEASVDATALVGEMADLLPRIDFVGSDPVLNTIAAQINADAFGGSLYHATSAAKLARNRPLAIRQPASFALVRTSAHDFTHVGLASVIPMNTVALAAYLGGKLSDNDLAPRHLARLGEAPEALLVFLVASAGAGKTAPRGESKGVFDLLVQACLLQIVVLAAQSGTTREIQVVVANAEPKWESLFRRMHFVECPEYESADQQTVFECRLTMQDAAAALDFAIRTVPRFADQLAPPLATPPIAAAARDD